jgi:hypothetical protein
MPVIYTKSALKKIKKDDLIYIFLCQQEMLSQLTDSYQSYSMSHPCEMNCKHCGLTTTEDDLGISLDCGELTCEGCFEEGKSKSIKEENKKLKEENKKLKEEAATNQRRATIYQFMSEYMEKADLFGEYYDYIREYYPDERTAAGDLVSSDEEPPERCEICDKTFDLHYTMNHCDGNLREKYDDYFGSEKDQGDVCPDCINTIC